MKNWILPIALFLFSHTTSIGQTNDEKFSKTLTKMFEVTGAQQTYRQTVEQMFSIYKIQYPHVNDEIWKGMEGEIAQASVDELSEVLSPVYSKYFTVKDLEDLIAFYETPVGKKFAYFNPIVVKESIEIGQQWSLRISEKFNEKLAAAGY